MNNEWFECKVKYEKTMENGMVKKVNEPYLVDALNFTEAESRIIEEITPFMTGFSRWATLSVLAMPRCSKLPAMTALTSFSVPNLYSSHSTKKVVRRRKTSQNILIQASDLRDAIKRLDEGMKGSMLDYTIASITETAIMDVFHYVVHHKKESKPEYEG